MLRAVRRDHGCTFCQVIDGRAGAVKIVEEELVVGFLDVRPVFKGHTLVVPREHHVTLVDVPEDQLVPLFSTVQRVQRAIVDGLGAQGTFVAANNVVSQSVPHLHVHVVPRTKGDGLRGFFWPRVTYDSPGEYEDYGERLRAALPPPS